MSSSTSTPLFCDFAFPPPPPFANADFDLGGSAFEDAPPSFPFLSTHRLPLLLHVAFKILQKALVLRDELLPLLLALAPLAARERREERGRIPACGARRGTCRASVSLLERTQLRLQLFLRLLHERPVASHGVLVHPRLAVVQIDMVVGRRRGFAVLMPRWRSSLRAVLCGRRDVREAVSEV